MTYLNMCGAGSAILLNALALFLSLFLLSLLWLRALAAGHLRDAGEYTRRTSAGAAAGEPDADSSCRLRAREMRRDGDCLCFCEP